MQTLSYSSIAGRKPKHRKRENSRLIGPSTRSAMFESCVSVHDMMMDESRP